MWTELLPHVAEQDNRRLKDQFAFEVTPNFMLAVALLLVIRWRSMLLKEDIMQLDRSGELKHRWSSHAIRESAIGVESTFSHYLLS